MVRLFSLQHAFDLVHLINCKWSKVDSVDVLFNLLESSEAGNRLEMNSQNSHKPLSSDG